MIRYNLIILIIFISNYCLSAQSISSGKQNQYSFKYLTVDHGLTNNKVVTICQDSKGLIWMGTLNGLNKFNGQTIVTYYDSADSTAISGNSVYSIFCDSKGELWIGNSGGLDIYSYDYDNFKTLSHEKLDWIDEEVYAIVEDHNQKLWFGAKAGLYSYDLNTHELEHFSTQKNNKHGFPEERVYRIIVDRDNGIWFSILNEGVVVYNQEDSTFVKYRVSPKDKAVVVGNRIERMYEDSQGNIWLGTYNSGLFKYIPETESFKNYIVDENNIYSTRVRAIFEDLKGDFFVGTRAGLYLFNPENQTFSLYAYEGHNFSNLSQNSILDSYIDKSGTLWLGTFAGGANYTNLNKKEFVHYIAGKNDNHYLSGSNIYGILEDPRGNLWIGGDNGLNYLDRKTNTFTYFTHDNHDENSLSYNDIKDLKYDKHGNLWIGTNKGGLNYYNTKTGKFTHYKHDPEDTNSLVGDKIYCILNDHRNNLWVIISPQNKFDSLYIDVLPDGSDEFIHLNETCYFGLDQDHNGNVYIGGVDGFTIFSSKDSTFNFIKNKYFIGKTNTIKIDSKNVLWIGSEIGLCRYDIAKKSFLWFSEDNGFPISEVFGILEDNQANLWVSTNTGLVKIENIINKVDSNNFRVYNQYDGIQSKQFNYNSYYKCRSGELVFGGVNGFNIFFPENIIEDTIPANVILTDLKIFNESVSIGKKYGNRVILNKSISVTNQITLGPRQNVFTLEFASPQIANPKTNTFKIKLVGLDKEWQYRKAINNTVTYTNLKPGKYTFMVTAANNDGYWNKDSLILEILVIPPFYKTKWFIGLAIMLVLLLSYLFYRWRVRQYRINEQNLKLAVEERTQKLNLSNTELMEQKYEILTQNEEIQSQNEELQAQRELIELKNTELEKANQNLEFLNDFGERLTSELNISDIFGVIEQYISSFVDFHVVGFGIVKKENNEIVFSNYQEGGDSIPQFAVSLDNENSLAAYCYNNKTHIVCNNLSKEYKSYVPNIISRNNKIAESVMYFPLLLGDVIIGVLTIQNYKPDAFSVSEISIIKKLLSYITIAVDNATAYSLVKKQKEEIERHKEYLEDIVDERTKNLEIAKNKAEESDRLKSAFLANMSHEIRTPLNAIIGFTNFLGEAQGVTEETTSYIKVIKSSGLTLLQLISDIVDFSKIEAGQLELFKKQVNINNLLEDIYFTFNENESNNKVSFILANKINGDITLHTDEIRLTQIFSNLISNAFKFTTHGSIEFGIKDFVANKNIVFYVKDTGIGIDKKHYDVIFNRFTKIDENITKLYRGVGLGLAITKHLVEKLGGEISIESKLGQGSEFIFSIPHVGKNKNEMDEPKLNNQLLQSTDWSNKVFLIAEDEPTNLLMLKKMLLYTKVKIYEAKDGAEAVEQYKQHQDEIDLVLLDIKMPKKDGVQAFSEIREINSNVVVIAQTAYAMANEELEIRNAGFNDFISKPILGESLFRILNKYLG